MSVVVNLLVVLFVSGHMKSQCTFDWKVGKGNHVAQFARKMGSLVYPTSYHFLISVKRKFINIHLMHLQFCCVLQYCFLLFYAACRNTLLAKDHVWPALEQISLLKLLRMLLKTWYLFTSSFLLFLMILNSYACSSSFLFPLFYFQ